jgi:two-component system OmpR family response regulator
MKSDGPNSAVVLVVDDDKNLRNALVLLLTKSGFTAEPVSSATAALNYTRQAPHAIVLDIHLPDMNGLTLAEKLRERWGAGIPIIVLSGDTSSQVLETLSSAGATYFFAKPVNGKRLVEQLRELLAASQPSA